MDYSRCPPKRVRGRVSDSDIGAILQRLDKQAERLQAIEIEMAGLRAQFGLSKWLLATVLTIGSLSIALVGLVMR